jgi:hypothetical protein
MMNSDLKKANGLIKMEQKISKIWNKSRLLELRECIDKQLARELPFTTELKDEYTELATPNDPPFDATKVQLVENTAQKYQVLYVNI